MDEKKKHEIKKDEKMNKLSYLNYFIKVYYNPIIYITVYVEHNCFKENN